MLAPFGIECAFVKPCQGRIALSVPTHMESEQAQNRHADCLAERREVIYGELGGLKRAVSTMDQSTSCVIRTPKQSEDSTPLRRVDAQ